ncbi:MAG: P-II family nitrogen regulator [Gemmataceae bacterium]|nr:P-II family nitrogen regulator [Gemmataceae bacterium]
MKEIKAYIRRPTLAPVLDALCRAGARLVAVAEVHLAGPGCDPGSPDPETAGTGGYGLRDALRLEVVCADQDVEQFTQAMLDASRPEAGGDGLIVVSDVARAIRVRDGASGEEILARSI